MKTIINPFTRHFQKRTSLHNTELTDLQGGTSAEYYHLTSAEYTELSQWLDNVTLAADGSTTLPSLTVTGNSVLGLNSAIFQPTVDSTTFFQVLDADGGTPVFNVDTVNERVGIGGVPGETFHISAPGAAGTQTLWIDADNDNGNDSADAVIKMSGDGGINYATLTFENSVNDFIITNDSTGGDIKLACGSSGHILLYPGAGNLGLATTTFGTNMAGGIAA